MNEKSISNLTQGVLVYPMMTHDPEDSVLVALTQREVLLQALGLNLLKLCASENAMLFGHLLPGINEMLRHMEEIILNQKAPEGFGEDDNA